MGATADQFEELRRMIKAGDLENFKKELSATGKAASEILCWDGKSLLIEAVWSDRQEFVEYLVPLSDLNHKDGDEMTALEHAIYGDKNELAKMLISGTDLGCVNGWGENPLMQAARRMSDEVVALIAAGSDLSHRTTKGLDIFGFVDKVCGSDKAKAEHLKGLIRSVAEAEGINKAASPANAAGARRKM